MKKSLLLFISILAPFFALAQGKVYNNNDKLIYKYDGKKLYLEDKESGNWKATMRYDNGKIYRLNSKGEEVLMMTFNGREIFNESDTEKPIALFDGTYAYFGSKVDPNAIIGVMKDGYYYRGKTVDPKKLLFHVEGDIPIAMLLFLNMAR